MPTWSVWLIAWVVATAGFLSIPASAMAARAYREARRHGVRKPGLFLVARVMSVFSPRRIAVPADIPQRVFVEWDVRWLSAGVGLANAKVGESAVELKFDVPQAIGAETTVFRFEPMFRRGSAVHGVIQRGSDHEATAVLRSLGV